MFFFCASELITSWYLACHGGRSICAVSPQSSEVSCHKVCHHKPHHATVPAWRHARQKWRSAAKMALSSHDASPLRHFHLLWCFSCSPLLLFVLLLVSLPLSPPLFLVIFPTRRDLPFLAVFSAFFAKLIVMRLGYSQDNVITRRMFESAMGDEVNAIHSILIRIHYVTLDRGAIHSSICHFLRNGLQWAKKMGRKKISIRTKLV